MKKIFISLCMLLTMYTVVYAQSDVKIYNNGKYIDLSHPVVVIEGKAMASGEDILKARGWAVYYDTQNKVLHGYNQWNSEIVFTVGSNMFTRRSIFGNEEVFYADIEVQEIDSVAYIPVRAFYEKLYGYNVEWDEENNAVKTQKYSMSLPATLQTSDKSGTVILKDFKIVYVEECFYKGKYQVRYEYTVINRGGDAIYAHWYDDDGNYLVSARVPLSGIYNKEYLYYNYFYIPKNATNIKFTLDKQTPEGVTPLVYWPDTR